MAKAEESKVEQTIGNSLEKIPFALESEGQK